MLQAQGLTKDYITAAGPVRVLERVDVHLNRGEAAAITGPSGSGKSTLLYLLGGLDRPTSGKVSIDAQDISSMSDAAKAAFRNQHIGFVFQDHALLPQCTVVENILIPTLVAEGGAAKHTERAHMLAEAVGLAHRASHLPGQLSGGERQRVAIARALIMSPSVVLCDEPTGNLDTTTAASVADLLLRLHEESQSVLVVVTHSNELAARFGQRYAVRERRLERV